jgi:peptide/nickel transport system permease protein
MLWTALLLWAVVTVTFVLVEVLPGDPAGMYCHETSFERPLSSGACNEITRQLGLDKPASVRYLAMTTGLLRGHFGQSMKNGRPVLEIIGEALPRTLLLNGTALGFGLLFGILLGTLQARRPNGRSDTALGLATLALQSLPEFLLGMALLWLAASVGLGLGSHAGAVRFEDAGAAARAGDAISSLILPAFVLGAGITARSARLLRSRMLEVMREDFVRALRARGFSESRVFGRHVLTNALPPLVAMAGLSLPWLFSGSVVVERVFDWPGLGNELLRAIFDQDTPVVVGCFFFSALLVVAGNVLADIAVAALDPRARQG